MGTLLTLLAVTGCDEAGQMMAPVIDNEPANTVPPAMVGEMKEEPEETPAEQEETPVTELETREPEEPSTPEDTTPPTVVEVGWYGDWQMTQPLTADSTVHPGDTVYTVVTFSEPVVHVVADDETARPALSIAIDGTAERYRILPHGVGFQSGEAKPLQDGTDDYLCKYTIPADTVGILALRIDSTTTDRAGNAAAEFSAVAPFWVVEMVELVPEPVEPEEPVDDPMEPRGEYVLPTLPPGYTLPRALTPTEATVLSEDEQALMEAHSTIGLDGTALEAYTTQKPADVISLLPYKDREEVYELFVDSIHLPFFAEAAEVMKEINIRLGILYAEAKSTEDFGPYQDYRNDTLLKRGFFPRYSNKDLNTLEKIYLEEEREGYRTLGSRYWIILEWYRLQLEHPHLETFAPEEINHESIHNRPDPRELLNLFRKSVREGNILGLDNPWN